MSRLISDILSAKEPEFSHNLQAWEQVAHKPAIDIVLAESIKKRARDASTQLGLDNNDTTHRELYYALKRKASNDSLELEKKLGINADDSSELVVKKIANYATTILDGYSMWSIKQSSAKKIIKSTPPKKLMKILSFRSIDAVLKRESAGLLIGLGTLVDPDYHKKLLPQYKKLKPSDFDTHKVYVEIISPEILAKLHKVGYMKSQYVLSVYQTGTILVAPPTRRLSADSLLLLSSIVESAKGIAMYSSYQKSLSVETQFGAKIAKLFEHGLTADSKSRIGTGWSSLHGLAQKDPTKVPQDIGPHLQEEDLKTPSLLDIEEITFWHDKLYVAQVYQGTVISCNIMDVLINLSSELPHEKSVQVYGQSYLWDELISSYLLHEPIRELIINIE